MPRSFLRILLLLMLCGSAARVAHSDAKHAPLRQAELLALVAGRALPENVVQHIRADGLAFHPDDSYKALLKNAGADPTVLKALDSAKVIIVDGREDRADNALLTHISNAGSLITTKNYDDAAKELTDAMTDSFQGPECGFVMGQILRDKQDSGRAEVVYEAVVSQDSEFPEAHTKLSYILYRTEDYDAALQEANTALTATPDNAEAHKNAGLALEELGKADAAIAEYRASLRLKPDYAAAIADLGIVYMHRGA